MTFRETQNSHFSMYSPETTVGGCRDRAQVFFFFLNHSVQLCGNHPQQQAHMNKILKQKDTYDLLNMWNMVQQNLAELDLHSKKAPLSVAFLTSGCSLCFPDYFWVAGNVAGASALGATPHHSQRMCSTPLSTSHLKRQCSSLGPDWPLRSGSVVV